MVRPLTALAACLATMAAASAAPDPLGTLRGRARVVVISAPAPSDPKLVAQREGLASARRGAEERDVRIVEAVGDGPEAVAIRARLSLPADAFRVVLVGKDGEAKTVSAEPIPPQRLFSTIDAMPMRRDEMRRRER